jgi:hypothetical protein
MRLSGSTKCIYEKDGRASKDKILSVVSILPDSLSGLGMSELFYHMLAAFDMNNKRKLMEITAHLIGAISMQDEDDQAEEEEDDAG